ncbi:hypothetical protein ACH4F0_08330 [Streptomyces chartreusis]|uniref:hypothetical protein n=1 Tax=Streptomyces chartreusis TaxID=1969 RepID=UPI0037B71BE3
MLHRHGFSHQVPARRPVERGPPGRHRLGEGDLATAARLPAVAIRDVRRRLPSLGTGLFTGIAPCARKGKVELLSRWRFVTRFACRDVAQCRAAVCGPDGLGGGLSGAVRRQGGPALRVRSAR